MAVTVISVLWYVTPCIQYLDVVFVPTKSVQARVSGLV
jgi:hypothetical protein